MPRSVPGAREDLVCRDDGVVFRVFEEFPPQAARVHDLCAVWRLAATEECRVPRGHAAVKRGLGRVEAEPL